MWFFLRHVTPLITLVLLLAGLWWWIVQSESPDNVGRPGPLAGEQPVPGPVQTAVAAPQAQDPPPPSAPALIDSGATAPPVEDSSQATASHARTFIDSEVQDAGTAAADLEAQPSTARLNEPGLAASEGMETQPEAPVADSPGDVAGTAPALVGQESDSGLNGIDHDLARQQATPVDNETYLEALQEELQDELVEPGPVTPPASQEAGSDAGRPAAGERFVVVRDGDSLTAIAHREYGDAALYRRIYNANRDVMKGPHDLSLGQRLRIPAP